MTLNTGPRPLRVRGVGRVEDEPRALLVCLSDVPSDNELRVMHDFLRDWHPLAAPNGSVIERLEAKLETEREETQAWCLRATEYRERMEQGQAAIASLIEQRELYRSRWLGCLTPEEAERLRAENEQIKMEIEEDEFTVMNLVAFVRRLSAQLMRFEPQSKPARQALEWLERNGVRGQILRAAK